LTHKKEEETRAKDVLPNIHCTQTVVSVCCRHPVTPRLRRNGVVCCWMTSFAAYGVRDALQCIVNGNDAAAFFCFVPGDLTLWPWHSNSSKRGTKHVFLVNLGQIHSAVPETFECRTNKKTKSHSALKTEPYLRAVRIFCCTTVFLVNLHARQQPF